MMQLLILGLWLAWRGLAAISPPSQVAIAAGSQADTEVAFTWLTNDTRDDDASCALVAVIKRLDSEKKTDGSSFLNVQATSECLRYTFHAAASSYGNYTSGRIHRVRLRGLTPDTLYHYRIEGDPESMHRHFRTLPSSLQNSANGNVYPLSFGVIGDLGQTVDSQTSVRHLAHERDLRLILHAGDMSYADSNGSRWDTYGEQIEYLSSRLQWMVCPGNHEIEADVLTGQVFVPYEARFVMPAFRAPVSAPSPEKIGCTHPFPLPASNPNDCTPSEFIGSYDWGNSFYAFTAGPARVISLNSYTNTEVGSAQRSWLVSELASLSTRRAETPWLIVMMHCPFYSSNAAHYGERQAVLMRDLHEFEDILMTSNVSIVFSGHVHAYERTHPVYRNSTTARGPSYIVVGDGGNREGHAFKYRPGPPWSAFRNGSHYGHGKITIYNDTHMEWQWWANNRNDVTNSSRYVQDSAWIINPYTRHSQPILEPAIGVVI